MDKKLPLSQSGIFDAIQGEGATLGVPMTFVRLAGCSVGCEGCDTDYAVYERMSVAEIIERIQRLPRRDWVRLTGGEPTDHPISSLIVALRVEGYRIALATSGVKLETPDGWAVREGSGRAFGGVDFLSVSPHGNPDRLVLTGGSQLNLVPGLGLLKLTEWEGFSGSFGAKFVTPLSGSSNVSECVDFVRRNPGFRLGIQAHKTWGLP